MKKNLNFRKCYNTKKLEGALKYIQADIYYAQRKT